MDNVKALFGDGLLSSINNRLCEHHRRRRPVTHIVIGLVGRLLDKVGAHVLELVFKLYCLGNRHAVQGNLRRAVAFVYHHRAAAGPERHLDCLGKRINPFFEGLARVIVEQNLLRHNVLRSRMRFLRRVGAL